MMNNICLINSGQDKAISKYGVDTYNLNRPLSLPLRLVRSIALRVKEENIRFFYKRKWISSLSSYQTLVVFDTMDIVNVCNKLYTAYPEKRLILYFWNPIKKSFNTKNIPPAFELWTFDYGDAKKYGMKYNGQFIFEKELVVGETCIEYDLYFVGQNKGRFSSLLKIKNIIEQKYGLEVKYRLVSPLKSLFSKHYSKRIPYFQVLEETNKSKCVIEYNQKGQKGLTQRSIESIFLQKKLITNNCDIVNQDFYRKSNIYIIKDNYFDSFQEFWDAPFEPYSQSEIERYFFSRWLRRMDKDQELNDTLQ